MSEGFFWTLREAFASRKPKNVAGRQRARLAEMVAYARAASPYFCDLYRALPRRVEDVTLLPVTGKQQLTAHFDEWATDREVTLEKARAFAGNPNLIGERFLGRYTLVATPGTTGTPAILVLDDRNMTVACAMAVRMLRSWLGLGDLIWILVGRGRTALTIAPECHSAAAVAAVRYDKCRSGRKRLLTLSVQASLQELASRLTEFRPAVFVLHASVARLLADEQAAGRLNTYPVLTALAAEGLPISEYGRIAEAFGTTVADSYTATECPFLGYGCEERWLHVNSDWAVLEPVDADYRPVEPGEQSHTVLVTNLANRVQPILRYDLEDSVVMRPDPCACGNPLPAVRVRGRSADIVSIPTPHGERVLIPPVALDVAHIPGVERFQIVQRTPTSLHVRLTPTADAEPGRVWQEVRAAITRLLADRGLENVAVELAAAPPEQSPGGKYRTVIPLRH